VQHARRIDPVAEVIRSTETRASASRWLRTSLLVLFVGLAVVATVQRGVVTRTHATFPIFRQSFPHLIGGQDLYGRYPAEQGIEARDRFKYSPTAALLFAPFSAVPFVLGLLLWTLLNALALYKSVERLFPGSDAVAALAIVFPALIAAVQSTSSNGLIAALMVASFLAIERGRMVRAGAAIAAGALMKLYPAAALPFVLAQPNRRRALGVVSLVAATLVVAPLLVVTPAQLWAQYRSWAAVLFADAGDLTFARSIMVVIRSVVGFHVENWWFQAVATMVLVTPLASRRDAWKEAGFRRTFLASLLIYVVIFNHQAENSSYVIAAVGLAVWFLSGPRTWPRIALLIACMAGLEAVPYFIVWLWLQFDLLEGARFIAWIRAQVPERADAVPEPSALAADVVEA